MPRTRRSLLYVLLFLGVSCGGVWTFSLSKKKLPLVLQQRKPSFYIPSSVTTGFSNHLPYVNISIENQSFLVALDLGFDGMACLFEKYIDPLSTKALIGERSVWGVQGTSDRKKIYKIPSLAIGDLVFNDLSLEEDSLILSSEGIIVVGNKGLHPPELGKVGWKLFKSVVLFLDLGHSLIGMGDSIETLEAQGYPLESFTKTPLLSNRNLLEIDVLTSNGPLRCCLDTGCTFNFINRANTLNEPLDIFVSNKQNNVTFSFFRIGGKDFGETSFYPLPIQLPIHIEAALGMKFFTDHQVILDFKNGYVYFAPNKTPQAPINTIAGEFCQQPQEKTTLTTRS
jgi:hypothetical protein